MSGFGPGCRRQGVAVLLGVALLSSAAGTARAAVYSYQGNTFTEASGPYTGAMAVSGSFELTLPLTPNLPPTPVPTGSLMSYSFSDGVETRTQADSVVCRFELATDSHGRIVQWFLWLRETGIAVGDPQHTLVTGRDPFTASDQGDHIAATGDDCDDGSPVAVTVLDYGRNDDLPGTWTSDVAAVPALPAGTLTLLGGLLVLLGTGALRRRGLARHP